MQLVDRILLSVTILLVAQSFPLAAQWVNGPEFNPSQKHAVVDKESFAKMQTTAIFMGLAGLTAVPVGVYLFVYDAATTPIGQAFHPLQGQACAGLVCFIFRRSRGGRNNQHQSQRSQGSDRPRLVQEYVET